MRYHNLAIPGQLTVQLQHFEAIQVEMSQFVAIQVEMSQFEAMQHNNENIMHYGEHEIENILIKKKKT
ncbi:hypothetical protein E2C01_009322 [Portunus trituberculatus]|uniref:Uncharacterized protein n=1 Tax=Portunus trituberculatus TaxID=210409 RepID=A0A5B7D4I9_PORTR|nr:hypothetical protein [Portunus trituberculatus]